jgi:O-methyltransferase
VLDQLYDKVSVGGYIIVDDYCLIGARTAVFDFRRKYKIDDPIIDIGDGQGAFWKKENI